MSEGSVQPIKRPHLILPDRYTRSEKRADYAAFWAWIYPHLVKAVEKTFLESPTRHQPSTAEIKDRVDKAKRLVEELRRDAKWSKFRIRDRLGDLLAKMVRGEKIDMSVEDRKKGAW